MPKSMPGAEGLRFHGRWGNTEWYNKRIWCLDKEKGVRLLMVLIWATKKQH